MATVLWPTFKDSRWAIIIIVHPNIYNNICQGSNYILALSHHHKILSIGHTRKIMLVLDNLGLIPRTLGGPEIIPYEKKLFIFYYIYSNVFCKKRYY